jgi:hypothetical protein
VGDTVTGWFTVVVLLPVILAESGELSPWLARRCVDWGARHLTDDQWRERYAQEWQSDLARVPGKVTKLCYAVTVVLVSVPRLRWRTWRNEREVPGMRAAGARAVAALRASTEFDELAKLIAAGASCALGFRDVAVNLATPAGDLLTVAAVGSPEMKEAILGKSAPRPALDRFLADCEHWGSLKFSRYVCAAEGIDVYVPAATGLEGTSADAWRPEYGLIAPLYGPTGELFGMLSLDDPVSGRCPGPAQRAVVEAFAEGAADALLDVLGRTGPPTVPGASA